MTYRDQAKTLAALSESTVAALVAALRSGLIDVEEFQQLGASGVAAHNLQAAAAADVALATELTRLGVEAAPLGITPEGDEDRLGLAFATLIVRANRDALEWQARRLARAEPLGTAQDTYAEGLRRHKVGSWTRVTDSNPCKVCRDLTGPILPASVTMFHHPGCSCTQRVILDTS